MLRNALKWSLMMPPLVAGAFMVVLLAFGFGYGLASLVTDSSLAKGLAGCLTLAMGLGAAIGVSEELR